MAEAPTRADVAIIGAGPVGLFAIFQLGMLGLKAVIFDALNEAGGQCAALYPEKPIYDIPGFAEIAGGELTARLREQAAPFAPAYRLGERIEGLHREPDGNWRLRSEAGAAVVKTVLIAAGGGAFGPNRPPLAGLDAYEGRSVFYSVRQPEAFRGRHVVIAGGGDSAADWACVLAETAASVALVHRRTRFRAAPGTMQRLEALAGAGRLALVAPFQLAGLEGRDGQLTAVQVRSLEGETRRLPADVLLPFYGLAMDLGPIAGWGLTLKDRLIAVDPSTCATSLPGVFAIGDIASYPGKLKLILCGFSEAAMAAHAIYRVVHPDRALHFEYSTMTGVPGRAPADAH